MDLIKAGLALWCTAAVLSAAEEVRPNLVRPGPVERAPQQDGVIGEGEYPTVFTGLIENRTRSVYRWANRAAWGRDAERLYFALELELPPETDFVPAASGRDDPAMAASRSAFYLMIRPDDQVEKQGYEGAYLVVDAKGNFYDAWEKIDWEKGFCQRDAAFNADWQVKTRREGQRFTVELSAPLAALKITGSSVLCSFGVHLPDGIVSWQLVGTWFDHPFAFGRLDLSAGPLAVQLPALGTPGRGEIAPAFMLRNAGTAPAGFEVRSTVARPQKIGGETKNYVFADFQKSAETVGADKPLTVWKREGELTGGQEIREGERTQLEAPGAYVLENEARENGRPIFYQKLPFTSHPPLAIDLAVFPRRGLLRATVSTEGAVEGDKEKVVLTVKSPDGRMLWQEELPVRGDQAQGEIPLEKLNIGDNPLDVRLLGSQGRETAALQDVFRKQDTPEWLAKRAGLAALDPAWAPAPWGPITAKENTVEVWGRTFAFAPGCVMQSLASQGIELLRAPMTLKLRRQGREETVALSEPRQVSVHPGQVILEQTGGAGDLKVALRQTIEFDGMNWMEVTLTPGKAKTVDALWVEIPLRIASLATFVAREGSSGLSWEHGRFDRVLPGLNAPQALGHLWIGDEKVGLSYFVESYQGWLIDSRKPRVEAEPAPDGGAVVKLRLINDPSTLEAAATMRFGLHPSPYRPRFAGFRQWRWGASPQAPVNLWFSNGQVWTANDLRHEPRTWKFLDDLCAEAQKRQLQPLLYLAGFATSPWEFIKRSVAFDVENWINKPYPAGSLVTDLKESTLNPDYAYFQEDWHLQPRAVAQFASTPTREQVYLSAGTSWADFAVFRIAEILRRTKVQGFFFDISYPNVNFDGERGLAYRTKDGVLEGTAELLAARAMWKRIYAVFEQERPAGSHPWIIGHTFAASAPLTSFFDGSVNGEEIKPQRALEFGRMASQDLLRGNPMAKPDDAARRALDGAAYRAIFGPQFGPANFILPQYGYLPELKTAANTRDMLAATFVHNNQLWNAYVEIERIADFWKKVEVPFGLSEAKFHGYWDNGVIAQPEGIKVSYWKKPGDYLVAVANWADGPAEAEVRLPEELSRISAAVDMESGESLPVSGQWKISVPAHDLRVFRLRAPEMAENESKNQQP